MSDTNKYKAKFHYVNRPPHGKNDARSLEDAAKQCLEYEVSFSKIEDHEKTPLTELAVDFPPQWDLEE
ncbi:MAG: hypothetical protein WBB43_27070 [Limnoraphis sp.]